MIYRHTVVKRQKIISRRRNYGIVNSKQTRSKMPQNREKGEAGLDILRDTNAKY